MGKNVYKLYTGSYNAPVMTGDGKIYQGDGKGIVIYDFDDNTGILSEWKRYEEVENASWLEFSADGKYLYAVNELDDFQGTKGGAVSSWKVEEDDSLKFLNCMPVMGEAPCHLNCDESGRHVYSANYNGGSMSSFLLAEDGSFLKIDRQVKHSFMKEEEHSGKNKMRQEKPHVHTAAVNKGLLWITDLGTDEISCFKLDDAGSPDSIEKAIFRLPDGSGPRSLAFSKAGNRIYVTCELSNEVAVLCWEQSAGKIECIQRISGLPDGMRTSSAIGGLVISEDGRFLYAGNRGHNSIVVFRLKDDGRLETVQWIGTDGENPRGIGMSPSGKWMLAANQDSGNLIVYSRDENSGYLMKKHEIKAGSVVCLQFMK